MKEYYVNFGTGAGNYSIESDDLNEVLADVESKAAYTQESIKIELDGEVVAILPWYGTEAIEDDDVTVSFGKFGFYGSWSIL